MYDINSDPTPTSQPSQTIRSKSFAALLFAAVLIIGAIVIRSLYHGPESSQPLLMVAIGVLALACLVFSSVQIADQWEKAVVLRLGKFEGLRGPGLFLIIPFIDNIVYWIDTRVLTTAFKA